MNKLTEWAFILYIGLMTMIVVTLFSGMLLSPFPPEVSIPENKYYGFPSPFYIRNNLNDKVEFDFTTLLFDIIVNFGIMIGVLFLYIWSRKLIK